MRSDFPSQTRLVICGVLLLLNFFKGKIKHLREKFFDWQMYTYFLYFVDVTTYAQTPGTVELELKTGTPVTANTITLTAKVTEDNTLKFKIVQADTTLPPNFDMTPNAYEANHASYEFAGTSLTGGTSYTVTLGLAGGDDSTAAANAILLNSPASVTKTVCTSEWLF